MKNALCLMLSILALALVAAGVGVIGANLATGRGIVEAPPHRVPFCDDPPGAPPEGYLTTLGVPYETDGFGQEVPPSRVTCIPCDGEGYVCGKQCRNCHGYGTVKTRAVENEPDCTVKILSLPSNQPTPTP